MENANLYKTQDFYSATAIIASGHSLVKINKLSGKTLEFALSISNEEAKNLIQKHWDRELKIPSRDLVDAINELKTRMYDRRSHAS